MTTMTMKGDKQQIGKEEDIDLKRDLIKHLLKNEYLSKKIWSYVKYCNNTTAGHSYGIMSRVTSEELCKKRIFTLIDYGLSMSESMKQASREQHGIRYFDYSFTEMLGFMKVNGDYNRYIKFYKVYPNIKDLFVEYANLPSDYYNKKEKYHITYSLALDLACYHPNIDIIKHLSAFGLKPTQIAFQNALASKDCTIEILKHLNKLLVEVGLGLPILSPVILENMAKYNRKDLLLYYLSSNGSKDSAKVQLNASYGLISSMNEAIRNRSFEIMEYLLEMTDRVSNETVFEVLKSGDKRFLSLILPRIDLKNQNKILDHALESLDLEFIIYIYNLIQEFGDNTNKNTSEMVSSDGLDKVAVAGRIDILQYILSIFKPSSLFTQKGLYGACTNGHLEVVKLMNEKVSLKKFPSQILITAFEKAFEGGHTDIALLLLEAICPDTIEQILISKVARSGNLELFKAMEKNIVIISNQALDWAVAMNQTSMVKHLVENGLFESVKTTQTIKCAANNGNLEMMILLKENGFPTDHQALESTALHGYFATTRYLVEQCNIIPKDIACHNAMTGGHFQLFLYLLSKNPEFQADPNILDIVCHRGHLEIIEYFLENRTERWTNHALKMIVEGGNLNLLKYLLSHEPSKESIQYPEIFKILVTHACKGNYHIVVYLINHMRKHFPQVEPYLIPNYFSGTGSYLPIVKYLHMEGLVHLDLSSTQYLTQKDISYYIINNSGAKGYLYNKLQKLFKW